MPINPTTLHGNWSFPTRVRFGPGRIRELGVACGEINITRPLLVTDRGLLDLPVVATIQAAAHDAGLPTHVFANVQANPVGRNVDDGVRAYREEGCDGVIALGGGSALDAGKAVALMVGQNRPIWDFEDRDDWFTRVRVEGMAPVVAVPTTAGTGSEVGRASVILDESDQTKKIIFHPRMLPGQVIADPELTLALPPPVTAATGLDALAHCLEAYCAPGFHPMADGIALEGTRLVKDWLPSAYADGGNLAARSHMLAAASMGAIAFQKGLGAVHALSHPIGALCNTHHGLTNAVLLPYVLTFNRSAIDDRLAALARYLDLPAPSFDALHAWLVDLLATLAIPTTLHEIGVDADLIPRLVPMALADPSAGGNPRPLDAASLERLLETAIHGTQNS